VSFSEGRLSISLFVHRVSIHVTSYIVLVLGGMAALTLGAEELTGDVKVLAADHNDLLTIKELLGHRASKTAEQMPLAVDNDLQMIWLAYV
jgi:hypothetical protein